MTGSIEDLAQLAKSIRHNGRSAWDDTSVRQKIAGFACEAAALRYSNLRQLTRRLKGWPPGPEGSVGKLSASGLNMRIAKFAIGLLGPDKQITREAAFAIGNRNAV